MSQTSSIVPQQEAWSPSVTEDEVHRTCEILPEGVAEILQWLYDHYLQRRISVAQLGKHVGIDGGNIAKLWRHADLEPKGRQYGGNINTVAEKLRTYRHEYELSHGTGQPDFLRTKYAGFIFNYCDQVANVGMIGRIYGNYGDGKTVALREYASLQPRNIIYYECTEASSFAINLRHFAQRIGVTGSASWATLRERILGALERRNVKLLIIDDLHAIFNWATTNATGPGQFCDMLRKLHDHLGIPIVICGTDVLPDRLEKGIYARALEQLTDRGDVALNLVDWIHPPEDLTSFFQFYGLPAKPPRAAQQIIEDALTASLRKLVFKLRAGARGANAMKQQYTWEHFIDAQDLSAALASDPLSALA